MRDTEQNLIAETIQFIQDNYDPSFCWLVESKHIRSLPQEKKKKQPPTLPDIPITPVSKAPVPEAPVPQAPVPTKTPLPIKPTEKRQETIIEPLKAPSLPIKETPSFSFETLSSQVKKFFPKFLLKRSPLEDHKPYVKALQAKVVILSFQESKESDLFLENIKQAIETYFFSVHILSMQTLSSSEEIELLCKHATAHLFLCSPLLYKNTAFLPFLKTIPSTQETSLGNSPLLFFEAFETYFTTPQAKRLLWQKICTILAPHSTQESS